VAVAATASHVLSHSFTSFGFPYTQIIPHLPFRVKDFYQVSIMPNKVWEAGRKEGGQKEGRGTEGLI
jgi:hypothetical protein